MMGELGKLLRLLQRAEYVILQGYGFADEDLSIRAFTDEVRRELARYGYERVMNHEAYEEVERG